MTKAQIKQLDKIFQVEGLKRFPTCKYCGSQADCLHHLIGRRHLATRWDYDNSVPVCQNCHNDIHQGHIYPEITYKLYQKSEKVVKYQDFKTIKETLCEHIT